MDKGWNASAHAWIREMGSAGDWGRRYVLDAPMLARVPGALRAGRTDAGARARSEVQRVLRPGGSFLIANLQSFNTSADPLGWTREPDGSRRFCIDRYPEDRIVDTAWRGIRVHNRHRPMHLYLQGLLDAGFDLLHYAEPAPQGVDDDKADRYRRVPNFLLMEWRKRP